MLFCSLTLREYVQNSLIMSNNETNAKRINCDIHTTFVQLFVSNFSHTEAYETPRKRLAAIFAELTPTEARVAIDILTTMPPKSKIDKARWAAARVLEKKKRKYTPAAHGDRQYPWRNGHQQTMAEFWLNHPIFYDKTQQHFKNKEMKKQLVQELIEQNCEEWGKIHTPLPTGELSSVTSFYLFSKSAKTKHIGRYYRT